MLGDKRVAFEEVTWLAETHLEDGAAFERRNQEPLYKACHWAERVSPTRWATAEFQSLAYIRGTCACFVEHLLAFCEPLFQDKWRCFLVCFFFLKKKREREREKASKHDQEAQAPYRGPWKWEACGKEASAEALALPLSTQPRRPFRTTPISVEQRLAWRFSTNEGQRSSRLSFSWNQDILQFGKHLLGTWCVPGTGLG